MPAHPYRFRPCFLACCSICLLFLASCSSGKEGEDAPRTHSFQIVEEDGIPVALTTGGPKYEGELFNYEYLLSLQEDEREESLLNQPLMFTTDETGYYYVTDYGDSRLAVFDSEGRYSHSIGRSGEGPGEFSIPIIQEIRDGIITIFDPSQRRVSKFRSDGTFIDVFSISQSAGVYANECYLLEDGRYVVIVQEPGFQGEDPEYEGIQALVMDAQGDTLWTSEFEKVKTSYMAMTKIGSRTTERATNYPYGGMPVATYAPDLGILFSNSWNPIIDVYDLDGTRKQRIRIDEEPAPTTREDLAYILDYLDRQIEEAGEEASDYMLSRRKAVRLPDYKAFWMLADVDDAGFIWLLEPFYIDASYTGEDEWRYRILSPAGEYLGRTTAPKGVYGNIACGQFMINEGNLETGEFELKVYRIVSAVSGLKYP